MQIYSVIITQLLFYSIIIVAMMFITGIGQKIIYRIKHMDKTMEELAIHEMKIMEELREYIKNLPLEKELVCNIYKKVDNELGYHESKLARKLGESKLKSLKNK